MKQLCALVVFFLLTSCRAAPPPAPAERPNASAGGLLEGIAAGRTRLVDLGHALDSKNPYCS